MKNIEQIKILATSSIEKALSVIDSGAVKIALVVDSDKKLLGTLSDGDIRRGLLQRKTLSDSIEDLYFKNPTTADKKSSKEDLLRLCSEKEISQIPIIDQDRRVVDLFNNALYKIGVFCSSIPITANVSTSKIFNEARDRFLIS